MKCVAWNNATKRASRRASERTPKLTSHPTVAHTSGTQAYWLRLYEEADSRAGDFIIRYRSSYVLVILLAALSLIVGEFAEIIKNLLPKHFLWLAALPEIVLLALAVLVLLISVRQDWHLKSIEYRLLAELFRKQKTLATLGWALAISGVEHLADSEGLSWVAWLLAASQRASPFPHCATDEAGLTVLRVEELELCSLSRSTITSNARRPRSRQRKTSNASAVSPSLAWPSSPSSIPGHSPANDIMRNSSSVCSRESFPVSRPRFSQSAVMQSWNYSRNNPEPWSPT